jgi:hypothetical protein
VIRAELQTLPIGDGANVCDAPRYRNWSEITSSITSVFVYGADGAMWVACGQPYCDGVSIVGLRNHVALSSLAC